MTCTPQPTMIHHSLGAWALFILLILVMGVVAYRAKS